MCGSNTSNVTNMNSITIGEVVIDVVQHVAEIPAVERVIFRLGRLLGLSRDVMIMHREDRLEANLSRKEYTARVLTDWVHCKPIGERSLECLLHALLCLGKEDAAKKICTFVKSKCEGMSCKFASYLHAHMYCQLKMCLGINRSCSCLGDYAPQGQ